MGKKQVLAVLSLFVFIFCVFALTNAQKCLRVSWIRKQVVINEDRSNNTDIVGTSTAL